MKFEIVEAYVIKTCAEDKPKGWSFHVYLPEWELDLRGIILFKKHSGWVLKMPHQQNYDIEEKRMIRYPVICFLGREKTKEWIEQIKEKAIAYVQEKITLEMEEKEKAFKEKRKK